MSGQSIVRLPGEPIPLSPHFTLQELTFSNLALRRGLDNAPNPAARENLVLLCTTLLEPARTLIGVPFHIDSGFRSPAVNEAVGGAVNSAHMEGRAADVIPIGLDLRTAFNILRNSELPFDQLIIECGAWLHLAAARSDVPPRRQALMASGGPGHWSYATV